MGAPELSRNGRQTIPEATRSFRQHAPAYLTLPTHKSDARTRRKPGSMRKLATVSEEWPPEPEDEPAKPKPDLRDFFKLGKPSEPALGKPLWASTPPLPSPPSVSPADPDRKARRRFRLAQRLRVNWKLIAALKFYHDKLASGKWTEVPPARRTGGRKLNADWNHYLTASRRLLGVVVRCVKDSDGNVLRDRKGRTRVKYYLRRDVWETVQTRLGFVHPAEPGASQSLSWNEFVEEKIERERLEKNLAFNSKLFNPSVEYKFRSLPTGFKMTSHLTELADELEHLVARARAFLIQGIDPETGHQYAREDRRHRQQWESTKPAKPPPSPEELFSNELKATVKAFMNKIRIGPQRERGRGFF
jgi:hypothetical protein